MPERYSISASPEEMSSRFGIEAPISFSPKYNAAPTQLLPVITAEGSKGFSYFYWGATPEMAKNKPLSKKIFTTTAESLLEKSAFRKTQKPHRCIIPLDGFYSWKLVGKKTSVPYRIFPNNSGILAVAGIWDEYENIANGEVVHTFSMITLASSGSLVSICERIPLAIAEENEKKWLDMKTSPDVLEAMIKNPARHEFTHFNVNPKISEADFNSPNLLKPVPPADQHGNYTLFS